MIHSTVQQYNNNFINLSFICILTNQQNAYKLQQLTYQGKHNKWTQQNITSKHTFQSTLTNLSLFSFFYY